MPIPTKWGIDCQVCDWSLTIVYGTTNANVNAIKDHLTDLMMKHLESETRDYKEKFEKAHNYKLTPEEVRKWVVRLKPPGYEKV